MGVQAVFTPGTERTEILGSMDSIMEAGKGAKPGDGLP
jgi:hypothetical protein